MDRVLFNVPRVLFTAPPTSPPVIPRTYTVKALYFLYGYSSRA